MCTGINMSVISRRLITQQMCHFAYVYHTWSIAVNTQNTKN